MDEGRSAGVAAPTWAPEQHCGSCQNYCCKAGCSCWEAGLPACMAPRSCESSCPCSCCHAGRPACTVHPARQARASRLEAVQELCALTLTGYPFAICCESLPLRARTTAEAEQCPGGLLSIRLKCLCSSGAPAPLHLSHRLMQAAFCLTVLLKYQLVAIVTGRKPVAELLLTCMVLLSCIRGCPIPCRSVRQLLHASSEAVCQRLYREQCFLSVSGAKRLCRE